MCIEATESRFFSIGDWGGVGQPGHTWTNPGRCAGVEDGVSTGSGDARPCQDSDHWAQKYVAAVMKKVAKTSEPQYIIDVGDHFYPGGVGYHCAAGGNNPPTDPDGHWSNQFDKVYLDGDSALKGIPWMGVLGNHDYGGYLWWNGWDQQIFQTWTRDDWTMPGQFWYRKVQYTDFSALYFFLESNFVDAITTEPSHLICQKKSPGCWGFNETNCKDKLCQAWGDSKTMVRNALASSTSEWHIVVTHFPPPTVIADPDFQDINTKYGIDLVVTGHTHYQDTGTDDKTGMNWVLTGGGGGVTTDSNPSEDGHDNAYGFVDFSINRTSLHWDMYSWGSKNADLIIMRKVSIKSHKASSNSTMEHLLTQEVVI